MHADACYTSLKTHERLWFMLHSTEVLAETVRGSGASTVAAAPHHPIELKLDSLIRHALLSKTQTLCSVPLIEIGTGTRLPRVAGPQLSARAPSRWCN